MRAPRGLEAVRARAKRSRNRNLAGTVILAVLFSALLLLGFVAGTNQEGVWLLAAISLLLWAGYVTSYWSDATPTGFTLTENLKYRLDRLVPLLGEYNKVHDDEAERKSSARKCRRQITYLVGLLRPVSAGPSVSDPAIRVDLFLGNLTDFAEQTMDFVSRLSGLIRAAKKIPSVTIDSIRDLVSALDENPLRYDARFTAFVQAALEPVNEQGATADHTIGRSTFVLAGTRVAIGLRSLPPSAQLLLLVALVSAIYVLSVVFIAPLSSGLSLEGKLLVYLGVLGALGMFWQAMRR